jgi:hypothetical protein
MTKRWYVRHYTSGIHKYVVQLREAAEKNEIYIPFQPLSPEQSLISHNSKELEKVLNRELPEGVIRKRKGRPIV